MAARWSLIFQFTGFKPKKTFFCCNSKDEIFFYFHQRWSFTRWLVISFWHSVILDRRLCNAYSCLEKTCWSFLMIVIDWYVPVCWTHNLRLSDWFLFDSFFESISDNYWIYKIYWMLNKYCHFAKLAFLRYGYSTEIWHRSNQSNCRLEVYNFMLISAFSTTAKTGFFVQVFFATLASINQWSQNVTKRIAWSITTRQRFEYEFSGINKNFRKLKFSKRSKLLLSLS